jgi:hypothetical protein
MWSCSKIELGLFLLPLDMGLTILCFSKSALVDDFLLACKIFSTFGDGGLRCVLDGEWGEDFLNAFDIEE